MDQRILSSSHAKARHTLIQTIIQRMDLGNVTVVTFNAVLGYVSTSFVQALLILCRRLDLLSASGPTAREEGLGRLGFRQRDRDSRWHFLSNRYGDEVGIRPHIKNFGATFLSCNDQSRVDLTRG